MYSVSRSAWGPRGDRYGPAMASGRARERALGPAALCGTARSAGEAALARTRGSDSPRRLHRPDFSSDPHCSGGTDRSLGANMARALRRGNRASFLGRVSSAQRKGWPVTPSLHARNLPSSPTPPAEHHRGWWPPLAARHRGADPAALRIAHTPPPRGGRSSKIR